MWCEERCVIAMMRVSTKFYPMKFKPMKFVPTMCAPGTDIHRSSKSMTAASLLLRCACSLFIGLMLGLYFVPPSFATSPVRSNHSILVGFGELYGNNVRHSGIDVAAKPQGDVLVPASGIISFCGAVPKTTGARIKALTIQTAEGNLVSVSPLNSVSLKKGDAVEKGTLLGRVASEGDPSNNATHIHVSLRVNKKYVDPRDLIDEFGADIGIDTPTDTFGSVGSTSVVDSSSHTGTHAKPSTTPSGVTSRSHASSHASTKASSHATTSASASTSAVRANASLSTTAEMAHGRPTNLLSVNGSSASQHMLSFSGAGLLKERQLQGVHSYQPASDRGVTVNAYTETTTENPFSRAALASIFFLRGLTLTLAGWGGYTYLDGKFDLASRIGQLAVRGQR